MVDIRQTLNCVASVCILTRIGYYSFVSLSLFLPDDISPPPATSLLSTKTALHITTVAFFVVVATHINNLLFC